jgi:Leucine-rich repeat (LRR) protein
MTLKDATISVPNLAKMDISYNSLTRVPLTIFTQSAFSCLLELDVSNNKISVLPSAESFGRFAVSESILIAL